MSSRTLGIRMLGAAITVALALSAGRLRAGEAAHPAEQAAREILAAAGVQGGLVVHLGCGDGKLTAALRANDRLLVHGLDAEPVNVEKARAYIRAAGLYGPVTADRFDGKRLPHVDNLVNLIVVEEGGPKVPEAELLRVLAPRGVALFLAARSATPPRRLTKPWPAELGEWNHFLCGPDNNAVVKDRVVGEPRALQWVAEPRWGRSHEELASLSAAVTAKGRLFAIVDEAPHATIRFPGQWRLVARDAFNGTRLWTRPLASWTDHLRHFRSGPAHLPRRLAAVEDTVYVTLGLVAPVTALDAASGEVRRVYEGTERTEEILCAAGVLYLAVGTSETERTGAGLSARGEPEPSAFRAIAAVRADSGERLWTKEFARDEQLLPLSLTVSAAGVFCQSTLAVARLDARTGKEVWKTPRRTVARRMSFSAPTVVAAGDVLLVADRAPSAKDPASTGAVAWGVSGWGEAGFERNARCELKAYAVETGRELWSAECGEVYNAAVDVFVVGDRVWAGNDYKELDLKTGQIRNALQWKGAPVGMAHHRCYRNKASEEFLFTGRSGIEVVSLEKGWLGNNSWIRGTCQYGILPANGLLYAPPNACACFAKVKLQGFLAVAPQRGKNAALPFSAEPALEPGPGKWGQTPFQTDEMVAVPTFPAEPAGAEDWAMYRHDAARSGSASTRVAASPKREWSAAIGGRLTQPVVAGGRVYIGSADGNAVFALNAADGKLAWTHTTGGPVDSAPTYHKGLLLTGSSDGHVTCLRASDGGLVWRFRAAPRERLVCAFGRLESVWPVHGSVLVQDGTVYVTAGRNSYLDGGMVLYRLDPLSGKEISRQVLCDLDPRTGRQTGAEPLGPFNMEGVGSDILSGDGRSVFMRHVRFDASGAPAKEGQPHLFCMTGLLNEEWFVRTYWIIGSDVRVGWGGWADAAHSHPFGRILCFDDERVYGYGRKTISSGATGHKADAYHLFCRARSGAGNAGTDRTSGLSPDSPQKGARKKAEPAPPPVWSLEGAPIVRAMVRAGDKLVVAGPPDLGQKETGVLAYRNEAEALAGFNGGKGVLLQVFSAADGKMLCERKLTAMPVFDGLSAANGRLFVALKDGTVECWGE